LGISGYQRNNGKTSDKRHSNDSSAAYALQLAAKDIRLQTIIDAWLEMPDDVKAELMRLVERTN
jgi:hypothetical protein